MKGLMNPAFIARGSNKKYISAERTKRIKQELKNGVAHEVLVERYNVSRQHLTSLAKELDAEN